MKKKSSRPAMVPREVIERCMAPRSRGGSARYTGNMELLPPPTLAESILGFRGAWREVRQVVEIPFDSRGGGAA